MAMMERLIMQIFERKKRIVDQVKHQTGLFDQHLASTLLIDGIDPPEWLIRSQPSAAVLEREELIRGLLPQHLWSAIPDSSHCGSIHEEAPSPENNNECPVDLGSNGDDMMDTCNGRVKLSVLPDGITSGALVVETGPHDTECKVFSPISRSEAESIGIYSDLELSLARLQRSKTRQQSLELRNSAKVSRIPSHVVKVESSEGNEIAPHGVACQTKFSAPSYKKCCADAQPANVPGRFLPDERDKNSEGNIIATSGIGCQTDMQCVKFRTSKCSADVQLIHIEEAREVPVISYEGKPISEISGKRKIYIDGAEVHGSFQYSVKTIPRQISLSGSDSLQEPLGKAKSLHSTVQEAIEVNKGDSCNSEVRSINCSKKVLRSLRSTCVGDLNDVIKLDGNSNGKKCKTRHEFMHQSTPLDLLQEPDERCRVDRALNEVSQNAQHESASESLTELRRISNVSDNDKITEMEKIGELLVEGSSCQVSKESKLLVYWGGQSDESRSVTSSEHVSMSAANLQNGPGCCTDLEGYVEDSAGGFFPSRNLAEVVPHVKPEKGTDDFTKDAEILIPSSICHPNVILEPKRLRFDILGGSMVGLDVNSTMTSQEPIQGSCLLRETSLKQRDDYKEAKPCEASFENQNNVTQLDMLPRQTIESSEPTNLVEQHNISDSNCGVSPYSAIGSLSSNRFEEGNITNFGEVKETGVEEQRLADSVCLEEDHEADIEPVLLEDAALLLHRISGLSSNILEGKTTNSGEQEETGAEEHRQADSLCSEEGQEADVEPVLPENSELLLHRIGVTSSNIFEEGRTTNLGGQQETSAEEQRRADSPCLEEAHEADVKLVLPDNFLHGVVGLSTNIFEEGKTTNLGEQEETGDEEQRQADAMRSEEGDEAYVKPILPENTTLLQHIVGSSPHLSNLVSEDQNDIVLEGFDMATNDDQSCSSEDRFSFQTQTVENATEQNKKNLELLGKSTCLNTPLQYHFSGNTDNQVSRLYQSVPNGLLEHVDHRSSLVMNDGEQVYHAFDGRSYSDCLPYCEATSTRNNRKPYASPVGKLWGSIRSNSGSSKQKHSIITELPSIIEEIELADGAVEGLSDGISVEMESPRREPLHDISEDPKIPVSAQDSKMVILSFDSTMTGAAFPTANRKPEETHKYQESKKRDLTRKAKGSKTIERGPNSVKRAIESPKIKLAYPNTSLKEGGPSISVKESKLHNIVSNITSFLPLIQQKQAAEPAAGKRNVKVKALEAAEAAKKQAEKKENERKMKKEALKLKRERIEKENIRRLELEKKRKDDERKKKEAEMALKKRLREEEEKREKEKEKEKEKKRKRVEETRRNQAGRHVISIAGQEQPEAKDLNTEKLRVDSGKQSMNDGDKKVRNLNDLSEATADFVGRKMMSSMEHDEEIGNAEPSYEISPYKCSDDEDEEEDDKPADKFVPSWARKRSIAQDVFRQQKLDPDAIFLQGSFCSISEVVRPLKLQLK